MDRIRKALDLARRDRARLLLDEEFDLTRSTAESHASVTPVIAPFVAPAESPVMAATPESSIEAPQRNAAPAPVISLASYTGATTRTPAVLAAHLAPPRAQVPVATVSNETRVPPVVPFPALLEVGAPAPVLPVPPGKAPLPLSAQAPAKVPVLRATSSGSAPSAPTSPGADAPERSQAASKASRPFNGVVVYTKTHVYTPSAGLLESKRIVNPERVDPAAAAFRMLRTQVLQRMEERSWRSLAILSPTTEDGKTTTAINLAVSLAYDRRHTVLLVDCDLKRPSIAGMLGIEPEFGLDDVLTGRAQVDQCLYHPEGFERLVILPSRERLANSSEMLSASLARDVVAELHAHYPERIVIYDLPPILGTDDALAFLPMADCALMVAAERTTKREDLLRAMELVTRTPIVGTVLNRSAAVHRAYG